MSKLLRSISSDIVTYLTLVFSISLISLDLYADEPSVIVLESVFVGDANTQPAASHIVTWEKTPSPDYLKWKPEQTPSDSILKVIDKKEMQRSIGIYQETGMERMNQRYSGIK